jgi:hypothetical protein
MSQFRSEIFISPYVPDPSQYPPEIVAILAACKANGTHYPRKVVIEHDPGCNIFSDSTVELRDHDCTPVSVTTSGAYNPETHKF